MIKQNSEIEDALKIPVDLTNSPTETESKGKVEKKSGKRIGYNYIIIKSLKESKKNDVIKCLYIKSLVNFGICVIKEGAYGDTKDSEGRDIKDRLIWQKELHEKLHGKVRLPKSFGNFEENGNYYLILERIKGKTLYETCKTNKRELRQALLTGNKLGRTLLDYMLQLILLLEDLHKEEIVHRDATAANFMITPAGKVAIIDMEMSYSLRQQFPSPPFRLGTYGYMSPQQEATELPTVKEDIFSVGAILLHMWTGISPSKLTTDASIENISSKVTFFVPDRRFAATIIQCLQFDPAKRPTLREIYKVVKDYQYDVRKRVRRDLSKPLLFKKQQIHDTIQEAIGAISSPLFSDEQRGWFSEDVHSTADGDKKNINKAWYTSFNKGFAGPMYMLSQAHKLGFDTCAALPHLQKGLVLIEEKYINKISGVSPSLHYGSSGIAASLATAIRERLIEPQTMYFDWINQLISVENTWPGFMDGMAGQGIAHWHCHPFLHEDQVQQRLANYVTRLLETQEDNGCWVNEKTGSSKKTTRGFARGVAGIVYFLLEYAMQYQERDAIAGAQKGLEWLMKIAVHKKDTIEWRSSGKKEIPHWWCEGAPGIALAFLKGFALLGEPKYEQHAIGALLTNPKRIMDNNLSQCHGLTGLGELYLQAFRVLQQEEWLERAAWITQVVMQLKKEHKEHGPYWQIEHEKQPAADFMGGNSGVIHYLMRYCYPEKIDFPMLGK